MASTVSITMLAPSIIRRSCTVSTLSVRPMSIVRCWMMSPVSISCLRKNVVTPVVVSPFITAQLMGAAPRYLGRSEACRLNVPNGGICHTTWGSILKAMTMKRSACSARSSATKSSSLRLTGCSSGSDCSTA